MRSPGVHGILKRFALFLSVCCPPASVWAHGGVGMDMDPCVERAGAYLIHFSAYQFQEYAAQEFCRSVPQTGEVVLVLDLIDPELRSRPAALRVVQESVPQHVLLDLPAQVYPNGVVNAEVNFEVPGRYSALMTVSGVDGAVRFPIRVAAFPYVLVSIATGILAGCGIGYVAVRGGLAKRWIRSRRVRVRARPEG